MDRRTFLKTSAALGAASLAAPRLATPALAQGAKVLRFVPQSNLANFDPVWGTQYVVRNAGAMVWDMLYGVDANLKPQRQMVGSEEMSPDGLTWTFKLRPGLKFHDGEPVLAKDGKAGRFCHGDQPGLADLCLVPQVFNARRYPSFDLKPYPAILRIFDECMTLPAFDRARPENQPDAEP